MLKFISSLFKKKYTLDDILVNCVTKDKLVKELQSWGNNILKKSNCELIVEVTFGLNYLRFIAYMNDIKVYNQYKLNKLMEDTTLINKNEADLLKFYKIFLAYKHKLSDRIGYQTITFINK